MSGAVSRAARPEMRRLLHNQIKKNLIVSIGLCVVAGVGQYFLINAPAKERYVKFFSTYNIEAEFNRMKNLGLFDSCGPSD
ncbi:cytochrome c oxidase subunit 6C-1-like [Onthophagus taurus]|uniref:cytochrome c oxidase subunit 6C-1-like n=1 Tax=Onthophagus taurus TaxID=166361 RepID=UPI0039BDE5FE